jgi:hypothetical protein
MMMVAKVLLDNDKSKETKKEDDAIEAFFNSEGDHFFGVSPPLTTYQDKDFSTNLMARRQTRPTKSFLKNKKKTMKLPSYSEEKKRNSGLSQPKYHWTTMMVNSKGRCQKLENCGKTI